MSRYAGRGLTAPARLLR